MTPNSVLSDALAGVDTKAAWSAAFIAAFGPTRRMIALKDGVPFLNVALTGAMKSTGGNIVDLGKTSDATVQAAADLMTGTNVLRVQGNGSVLDMTMGLTPALQIAARMAGGMSQSQAQAAVVNYDVFLSANPTATSGIALASSFAIRAPADLPSGTGPAAPLDSEITVAGFRLIDYSSGSPVVAGTSYFTQSEPTMVMDIPWMAAEMGDIKLKRVPDGGGVVLGTGGDAFYFSGGLRVGNKVINGQAPVPLHQVQIRAKPHGRWASHPFQKDFDINNDTYIPPPHKIEILGTSGQVLDVIELYSTRDANNTPGSGWPVNDPRQAQADNGNGPVRPWWNHTMVHQWWSHRPKFHSKAFHLNPGVEDEALHPKNVRNHFSDPLQWPLLTGGGLADGLGAYKICPKWSRAHDNTFDTTILDTFYVNIGTNGQPGGLGARGQLIGYGFEPGSNGKHTWYMGPGGSRHDRAAWPHIVCAWAARPDGVRIHGAVPHKELLHHWLMGYANHSCHYFTDADKGYGIPKSKVLNGEICYQDTYYRGGSEAFRPDLPNNGVRLLSAVNHGGSGFTDKYGRRFTNEWSKDYMHSQSNAALGAYTYVSPEHVMLARHSFTTHVLAAFDLTQSFSSGMYLAREHAWYNWQFSQMWLIGNNHPDNFTTLEIEAMWGRHLEQVYDVMYPIYTSGTDAFAHCLRNLGMGAYSGAQSDGVTAQLEPITDSKAFYFGQVFLFMKQSGSWARMRARSAKCAWILDAMLNSLAKYAVGGFIDCNGRVDKSQYYTSKYSYTIANPVYPQHWGEMYPVNGQLDWLREPDGVLRQDPSDVTNTMHFRAQYLRILKDFFPEYTIARLDQAIGIMNGFYAEMTYARDNNDTYFNYRFAMMGLFKAPTLVGPPA
jgi:hypothetical protein